MTLATALLIAAIVCGLAGAIIGQRGRDYLGLGTFVTGGTAMVALNLIAFTGFAVGGVRQFGLVHLLYLMGVVGLPVMGVTIALLARFYKRGTTGLPVLLLASLVPGLIGLYGTHIEPFNLRVDAHRLVVPDVNRVVRLGVLADLQTNSVGEHENEAVDALIEAKPQIVLVPGDLFEMDDPADYENRQPEFVELVRRLVNNVETVVIVEGDHDNLEALRQIGDLTGAVVLGDQVLPLQVGAQEVLIAGTSRRGDRLQELYAILSEAKPETLTIMLAHIPDVAERFPEIGGTDLVVAGHTHGGQIAIPGIGPLVTFSDVPKEVAAGGLHVLAGRNIYVSTGVGMERGEAPQVRLGVRPSVGVIDVVPE